MLRFLCIVVDCEHFTMNDLMKGLAITKKIINLKLNLLSLLATKCKETMTTRKETYRTCYRQL